MRTQRTRWVQKSYFFTTLSRKLCSFNPTDNVFFRKETKKNRCPCNYLGNGSKNVFVRVELIFPLFCLFQGKNYNANRSPQSRRHRWVQCLPLSHSTAQLGSLSPMSAAPLGSILTYLNHSASEAIGIRKRTQHTSTQKCSCAGDEQDNSMQLKLCEQVHRCLFLRLAFIVTGNSW